MSQASGACRYAIRLGRALALARGRESALQPWMACLPRSDASSSGLGQPVFWATSRRAYAYPPHSVMSMPSLSPTMTMGNITKWRKKEGDQVAPGQVVAEVETDKATIDWESMEDGYIAKILVPDGTKDIEVGAPVAVLVEEASEVGAFKDYTPEGAGGGGGGGKTARSSAEPAMELKGQQAKEPAAPAKKPAGKTGSFPPHQVLNMPALSPTMNQGNILEWKKKVGDTVAPGDLYCEVETDKATIGWDSQEEGFIAQLLKPSGAKDVPVGVPVIVLVEDKEAVSAFASYTAEDAGASSEGTAEPAKPPEPAPSKPSAPEASAPKPATGASAQAAASSKPSAPGARVKASPYAKKLAAAAGLELSGVSGTGPGGRIVAEDVQAAVKSGKSAPAKAPAAGAADKASAGAGAGAGAGAVMPSGAQYVDVPHSQIRRVTAQRLLESKQTIPHYYLTVECQVDALLKLREQINSTGAPGVKISVNDFIIKAAALALKKVPGVNASWQKDFIRQFHNVDVSVAVQTPVGLLTPIVWGADTKGLGSISSDVKSLAAKAKEGKLQPSEFVGGTFTISNLGMLGVKQFAAIINPPQSAILAIGAAEKKVVLSKAGQFEEVTAIHVTMSCDHRVIDGAMGAEWLQAFRGFLEKPYTMLL